MTKHKDPELYGLPDNVAALFQPTMRDLAKFPRIGINLACAHVQVGNYATAAKLLCDAMKNGDNGVRLEAAATVMDITMNKKAPLQIDQFQQAGHVIDEACERGNVKAMNIRHQLSKCSFDLKLG